MSVIDEIKARVSLQAYVASDLGKPFEHTVKVWHFRCPFHSDDTASFAVYSDGHYHCFGCQKHGDIIDYAAERLGKSTKEAIEYLSGDVVNLPKYRRKETAKTEPEEKKRVDLPMDEQIARHADVERVMPYLLQRHISREVIDQRLIGAKTHHKSYIDATGRKWDFRCNQVALPYIFGDRVYSLNYRRDDLSAMESLKIMGEFHKMDMFRFLQIDLAEKSNKDPDEIKREKVLYHAFGSRFYRPETPVTAYGVHHLVRQDGEHLIYPRRPYCILTEGEVNQLSAEVVKFYSLAVKAVVGVNLQRLLQNVRLILVAVDPDPAGWAYAEKILEALGNDHTRARLLIMPDGFGDMNEMLKAEILADKLSSKPYYLDSYQ